MPTSHAHKTRTMQFHKKDKRRTAAQIRQATKYTPQEKLDLLDKAFGIGIGAVEERARLAALIAASTTA